MKLKLFSTPIYPIIEDDTFDKISNLRKIGINSLDFLFDEGVDCDYDESKVEIKTVLGKNVIYDVSSGIPNWTIELNLTPDSSSIQVKPFKYDQDNSVLINLPIENILEYILGCYNL